MNKVIHYRSFKRSQNLLGVFGLVLLKRTIPWISMQLLVKGKTDPTRILLLTS